ncbi:hypothetical protein Bca52824_072583 [Brassica carinata]|uniref:Uncharacterized protein n=1 Tax=Brassica carinata TaxID=52824 RepID=A0A8X7Q897_BRACI|nr:hypothetical protein Bca52824_072583 [Brassica carinata]
MIPKLSISYGSEVEIGATINDKEAIKGSRVSKLYDAAGNSRARSTVHRNPPNSSPPEIRIRRHLSSLCELSLTSHFKPLSLLSDCCFVEGLEMQW